MHFGAVFSTLMRFVIGTPSTPSPSPTLMPTMLEQAQSVVDLVGGIVDIFGGIVSALAVVAAGLWAYFKFVRGRTFRPRLEVEIEGRWQASNGSPQLHVTVSVKNIGLTDVTLLQEGTALFVSRFLGSQGSSAIVDWQPAATLTIFEEHEWIEPAETITDDLLADLHGTAPEPVRIEVHLVWRWRRGNDNIVVKARKILWPGSDPVPLEPKGVG
jgi:hypothetical protein